MIATYLRIGPEERRTTLYDVNGDPITLGNPLPVTGGGGGGDVQYTEGDTDESITGTAMLWEDAFNTLAVPSATKPLPVKVIGTANVEIAGAVEKKSGAVTVSTAAVIITPSNIVIRHALEITNNGTGTLYVSFNPSVATSGANMGLKVLPGGSFSLGPMIGLGSAFYGIYSEAAASQNVSYIEWGTYAD